MNILSDAQFSWFLTLAVGLLAVAWLVYDVINLVRVRGADGRDPVVSDKRFGYMMGIVIGLVGIIGVLRFRGVL